MVGGSVEISAPGDVWLKAGRNTNLWAGRDAIVRAKNSFDITATDRDGRIKAEQNLFMLSGNGGNGGTLIESRGSGPIFDTQECGERARISGVVICSTESPFVAWSNQIYLRTGGPGISGDGPIVLDANRGDGVVTTYANTQQNYLNNGVFYHFRTSDESVGGPSAAITDSSVLLPGDTCILGGVVAAGAGLFDGVVASTQAFAAVTSPLVGSLEGDSLAAVQEAIAECQQLIEQTIPNDVGQAFIDGALTPLLYGTNRPGNDEVIEQAQASLRVH